MNQTVEIQHINFITLEIINRTIDAIKLITIPRYFMSERGYVGEFYSQLKNQNVLELFPQHTIVETEVQKRINEHYGLRQRPDILIHIPIETGLTANANENNFVVYAFKLDGANNEVDADFAKLEEMFATLRYEVGLFININAHPNIFLTRYNGNFKNRIHELSITLEAGQVLVKHSYFNNNAVVTEDR